MASSTSISFNVGVKWDKPAIAAIMGEIANINALQNERLAALRKGDAAEANRLAGGVALAQIALDKEVFRQRQALLKESIANAQDMGSAGYRETERAKLALQKLYAQQDKEEQIRVAKEIAEEEKKINAGVAAEKKALIEDMVNAQRPTPSVTGRGLQTFARSAASFGLGYESSGLREAAAIAKLPEQIQAITFALQGLGLGLSSIATLGIAGVAASFLLIMKGLGEVFDKGHESVSAAVKGLTEYYKLIQTETTDTLEAKKRAAEIDLGAATRTRDDLQKKVDDLWNTFLHGGPAESLAARTAWGELNTQLEDANKNVVKLTADVWAFGASGDSSIVKARTELVKNQDAQDKALQARKDEREALTLSAAEITKRIAGLKQEALDLDAAAVAEIQTAQAQGMMDDPKHAERMKILQEKIDAATTSAKILGDALPAVTLFEKFAEGFKSIPDSIKDFAKELTGLKKATEIRRDIADLDETYAEQQRQTMIDDYRAREKAQRQDAIAAAKDREKYNESVAKLASDSAKKQKDLFDKYNDDRLKRLQDYLLKEAEAIAEYNKKRRRMVEDTNDDLTELAAKGDVAGFVLRQRKAVKDLKRLDEDFADEQAKRKAEFDLKNKQAEEQYAKELAAQIADDAVKLRQLQDEMQHRQTESERLTKELQDLERQWAEQDRRDKERLEKEHYERQKLELIAKLTEQETLNSQYWKDLGMVAANALKSLHDMALDFTARIGALAPTPIGSVGYSGSGYGYSGGGGGYIGGLQSNLSIGDIHIGAGNAVSKKDVEMALQDFSNHIARHIGGAGQ